MRIKFIVAGVFVSQLFGLAFFAQGQTGPAGVGNSTINKVWLDASYLTGLSNGSRVTTWTDRSGNAWNAYQNTATNRPSYIVNQLNGYPVIRFDRTAAPQYLNITSAGIGAVMSNSSTLFAVTKPNSGGVNADRGQWQSIFGAIDGYSGILIQGFPTATHFYIDGWVGNSVKDLVVRGPITQGEWYIATRLPVEVVSGTTMVGYVNGSHVGSNSSNLQIKNHNNHVRLGASASSGIHQYLLNGEIAEIILFNVNLNDAQRIIVDNYLAAKYSLTVSNDFYSHHDTNYIREVQGIGTTDGAANKHSVMANGRGLLISELNNTLNAANEFLFAGHDTNTNSIVVTNLPSGEQNRWQRVWYVEKTGNIDAKLSFDFSQAGISPTGDLNSNLSNYKLLYRPTTSGPFSIVKNGNDIVAPTLENLDQLSFTLTDAQILNGYYTIGYSPGLTWTGAVDDRWENAANWNLNRVPTENDHVYINSCTTCPQLNQSVTISGLRLGNGSTLDIKNNMITVLGMGHSNGARIVSNVGAIKAVDFGELKNSIVMGSITLEKTGGSDNHCYGGNTFSTELKIVNSSNSNFNVGTQVNNVVH